MHPSVRTLASDTADGNPLGASWIGTLPQIDTTDGVGDIYPFRGAPPSRLKRTVIYASLLAVFDQRHVCVWLRIEADQRRLPTCALHGDGTQVRLSDTFRRTFQYIPILGGTTIRGGSKGELNEWWFYGAHVKNKSTHGLGA